MTRISCNIKKIQRRWGANDKDIEFCTLTILNKIIIIQSFKQNIFDIIFNELKYLFSQVVIFLSMQLLYDIINLIMQKNLIVKELILLIIIIFIIIFNWKKIINKFIQFITLNNIKFLSTLIKCVKFYHILYHEYCHCIYIYKIYFLYKYVRIKVYVHMAINTSSNFACTFNWLSFRFIRKFISLNI